MASVLIIEDNADLRQLYRIALRGHDIQAVFATNGEEALTHLKTSAETPRFIVLDMMMPVMDGWEFLDHRKQCPVLSTIPVVVCSATADRIPPGIEILRKPVVISKFLEIVDRYK
ncbi:MAG TPA: response regulator [Bdellovibrionales bacterium]|jgi:CheY-like chemotaxis protein|nr:response regulator [Bdellovibrionales bacterium]